MYGKAKSKQEAGRTEDYAERAHMRIFEDIQPALRALVRTQRISRIDQAVEVAAARQDDGQQRQYGGKQHGTKTRSAAQPYPQPRSHAAKHANQREKAHGVFHGGRAPAKLGHRQYGIH